MRIKDVLPIYNLASLIIEQAKEDMDNGNEDAKLFLDSDYGKSLIKETLNFENQVEKAFFKHKIDN